MVEIGGLDWMRAALGLVTVRLVEEFEWISMVEVLYQEDSWTHSRSETKCVIVFCNRQISLLSFFVLFGVK